MPICDRQRSASWLGRQSARDHVAVVAWGSSSRLAPCVGLMLAYGLLGGGSQPALVPGPTPPASAEPTVDAGGLRPKIEPRLSIPVRPDSDWTVVEDRADYLQLAYFLDDIGSTGYNVGLMVVEPHGVYDPVLEGRELPLPDDLIGWIQDHPDLESGEPFETDGRGSAGDGDRRHRHVSIRRAQGPDRPVHRYRPGADEPRVAEQETDRPGGTAGSTAAHRLRQPARVL